MARGWVRAFVIKPIRCDKVSGGIVLEYQCRVESWRKLTPSVFELTFSTDRPLVFKAGQYVSIVVPPSEVGAKPLRRPYSIASAPEKTPIELCVQRIEAGPGSNYLANLRPGDPFVCFAPYGFLLYRTRPQRRAFFIATGTGIAPFRSMILSEEFRRAPPAHATCLLGVRNESEILYASDLSACSQVNWVPCLSRVASVTSPSWGGRVTAYLQGHSQSILWSETDFYLCGNGAMIEEVKNFLKEKGVGKEAIFQEIYFKPSKESRV